MEVPFQILRFKVQSELTWIVYGSDMSATSVDVPVAPFPCTKVERVSFDDPNILDYLKK